MKKLLSIFIFFTTLIFAQPNDVESKVMMVLQSWNEANNAKDTDTLSRLYASKITYYGSKLSRTQCIEDKKRLFKKYPHFSQIIKDTKYISLAPRLHKVLFEKHVRIKPNEKIKVYPSYLIIDTSSTFPAIAEEGDAVTDKNIKKNKAIKTFTFDGIHSVQGTIEKVKSYGPPGFGEDPEHDQKDTAYILRLPQPIRVIESDPNEEINHTTTATEIQLVAFEFIKKLDVAATRHQKVVLAGEFFSGHTGHHIRELLMDVKSVKLLK